MVNINGGMVSANDLAIVTSGGSDTVTVTDGAVSGGNNGINSGSGNDTVTVSGGSVDGTNNGIVTGGGADNISISNADVMGGVSSVNSGGGNDTVTLGDNAMTAGVINGAGGNNDTLIFTQTVLEPECSDLINNIFPTLDPDGDMVTINGITYQWTNFEVLMPNFICTQPFPPPSIRLDVVRSEGCDFISGQGITCGFRCSNLYVPGDVVLLQAMPDKGYEFSEWTGSKECLGSNSRNTIRMVQNMTCVANCVLIDNGEQDGPLGILVEGELESEGDTDEDMEITLITSDEDDVYQNVEIEINFPEGTEVNDASIGDEGPVEEGFSVKENSDDFCEIVSNTQVNCFLEELTEETTLIVNLFVPNLGQTLQAQVLVTTESASGKILEQLLNIVAGSGAGAKGVDASASCSLAETGTDGTAGILFLLLIPAVVLFRRLVNSRL